MNFRTNMLIAVSAIALAAGPAFAGHHENGGKMDHGKKFEAMDADSNGSLTMDEVKAYYEKKEKDTSDLEDKFAKADSDGNGEISKEEWDAAHAEKEEGEKEGEKEEAKDDGGEG